VYTYRAHLPEGTLSYMLTNMHYNLLEHYSLFMQV